MILFSSPSTLKLREAEWPSPVRRQAPQMKSVNTQTVSLSDKEDRSNTPRCPQADEAQLKSALGHWECASDIWLEDGNVILVADAVGYRVGRGVLSLPSNSKVFEGMFALGDKSHEEVFKGCAVVHLPDSNYDVLNMLKAIFFRQFSRKKSKPSWNLLMSLTRMSTKYMIDDLRADMIDILSMIIPSRSDTYERSRKPSIFKAFRYVCPDDVDPLQAVQLSCTCEIPCILPAACYESALLGVRRILDPTDSFVDCSTRQLCMAFRDDLMGAIEDIYIRANADSGPHSMPYSSEPRSPWSHMDNKQWHVYGCSCSGRSEHLKAHHEKTIRRLECDIFLLLRTWTDSDHDCCNHDLRQYLYSIQSAIWKQLPKICGFADWEAVDDAQKAALARDRDKG